MPHKFSAAGKTKFQRKSSIIFMNNSEGGPQPHDPLALSEESSRLAPPQIQPKAGGWPPVWPVGSGRERLLAVGMVIAYAVIFFILAQIAGFLLVRGTRNLPSFSRNVLGEVLLALCAIGATAIAAKLEKRSFSAYGFRDRLAGTRFLWGFIWGFVSLTLFLLGLRLTQHYYFGTPGIHGAQIVRFGLLYLALFLAVAFFEEFLTRGYALFKLSEA